MDYLHHPFPSRRTTAMARNGMVATSQPLAAQAGLDILRQGGNAIDAAVAAAACLTVVEPTSNGIGGDAFALIWAKGRLHGLNSSGPAPKALSIEAVTRAGHTQMPSHGFTPVTVPGAPAAWAECVRKFGRLPLARVLKPAIDYARNGYPLTPVLARYWSLAHRTYSAMLKGEEFRHWFETFAPNGRPPAAGEMWSSPGHAATLEVIADTHAKAFYSGELAEQIHSFSARHQGYISAQDLADFSPQWVEPIGTDYRGWRVWEIPPNGQGLVALMALNILAQFPPAHWGDEETVHRQIEAIKLAFADGREYITDPGHMQVAVEHLLSPGYASKRQAEISATASQPQPSNPPQGGTVYLATADGEGNMVSFIQSNYMGFGSGLVVPGTGIALQNRGHNFSLDPSHHNALAPGKRTYHTIIPGFLTKEGQPVGPFGVMGGFMQPQGHVQVVMNLADFGLNPQAALDAPRWQWLEANNVAVEHHFPAHLAQKLARRGHQVRVALESGGFGRGQIIIRDPDTGVLAGATEPRTDGAVACY